MAEKTGLPLIGFVQSQKTNIYTCAESVGGWGVPAIFAGTPTTVAFGELT